LDIVLTIVPILMNQCILLNNLDKKAVHKNDFKIPKERHAWIIYKDKDY